MVPGVPCVDRGNWGSECDISCSYHALAFCEQFTKCRFLERFMSYTLVSYTNAHAVRGRPTLKDSGNSF